MITFSFKISFILKPLLRFTSATIVILGDVTYGACCVDDYTARALGCEMLVHYGHSCLVPINQTSIKTLYVFVEISVDAGHLSKTIRRNFPTNSQEFEAKLLNDDDKNYQSVQIENSTQRRTKLALVGTVQFVAALQSLAMDLKSDIKEEEEFKPKGLIENGDKQHFVNDTVKKEKIGIYRDHYDIIIPQIRPLSPGEVLGCTAPKLDQTDALIYIGDGRFHLESIMIANPTVPAFRYDPYSKKITREYYDHKEMRIIRSDAVKSAKNGIKPQSKVTTKDSTWGIVLGTLGRQGSLKVLETISNLLRHHGNGIEYVPILISELSPQKISLFENQLNTFVQTSCPRLSIDWGYAFPKPLLSPYEAAVTLDKTDGWDHDLKEGKRDYPMDFYANDSRGPWTPRYGLMPPRRPRQPHLNQVKPQTLDQKSVAAAVASI